MKQRIPSRFGRVGADHAGHEENGHGAPHRPSVFLRAGHAAQRVGKSRGNGENQNDLNEIRQRIGILVGMRAVGVEKPAAVRAKHLDSFLGSDRTLRNQLFCYSLLCRFSVRTGHLHGLRIQQLCGDVRLEILDHSLRYKKQCNHQASGQQHPQNCARQIHPKIPEGFFLAPGNPTDHSYRQGYPRRSGHEIVIGKPGHLGEVAHRRFARIGLPVRVGSKRSGSVKRQIRGHVRKVLGIPWQPSLETLDQIENDHGHAAEKKHGYCVFRPAHFSSFVHAGDAV